MTSRRVLTEQDLTKHAAMLARRGGVDWRVIADQAVEIVVFGSRAVGLEARFSDLDVLIVNKRKHPGLPSRVPGFDLLFRTEDEILSANWLKSELAGHIAVYGRWLQGAGEWRNEALAVLGECNDAAQAKQRRISRLAEGLRTHWDSLTPDFRRRNLLTLRREKQRFQLLQSSIAVPPTRLLDIWADPNSARSLDSGYAQSSRDAIESYCPSRR